MSESTSTTSTTPVNQLPAQGEPFFARQAPLANRLFALHVDKLLFLIAALLGIYLLAMGTWLYFHPSW